MDGDFFSQTVESFLYTDCAVFYHKANVITHVTFLQMWVVMPSLLLVFWYSKSRVNDGKFTSDFLFASTNVPHGGAAKQIDEECQCKLHSFTLQCSQKINWSTLTS